MMNDMHHDRQRQRENLLRRLTEVYHSASGTQLSAGDVALLMAVGPQTMEAVALATDMLAKGRTVIVKELEMPPIIDPTDTTPVEGSL